MENSEDIKMIDAHFFNSLNANGDLLGAWLRIKKRYCIEPPQQNCKESCPDCYGDGKFWARKVKVQEE